ncbi:hypothetical protein [Streptomyces sp. SAI-127]|uniref:hypothetical protein n=1 Tax=Streptomyces sp. SAI-127 TaxID=2940543 RepID=UPI0024730854|nr:hypothetical protein [Streptomyces sp. SAI-127]
MVGPCEAAVDAHARLNDPGVDYDKQWQPEVWQALTEGLPGGARGPAVARGHLCGPSL